MLTLNAVITNQPVAQIVLSEKEQISCDMLWDIILFAKGANSYETVMDFLVSSPPLDDVWQPWAIACRRLPDWESRTHGEPNARVYVAILALVPHVHFCGCRTGISIVQFLAYAHIDMRTLCYLEAYPRAPVRGV